MMVRSDADRVGTSRSKNGDPECYVKADEMLPESISSSELSKILERTCFRRMKNVVIGERSTEAARRTWQRTLHRAPRREMDVCVGGKCCNLDPFRPGGFVQSTTEDYEQEQRSHPG